MTSGRIIGLLTEIGLQPELLRTAASDWQLRADLGLSSAETFKLQRMLEQLGCVGFSLWGTHDHSLQELEQLIDSAPALARPSAVAASDAARGA
ncbi:hypothetical protein BW21_4870 [Burkholderia humptydooensis]|uniref:hypothetical protein n=1 Tax=Burkholderia humptydooensis TaxID=430531 RepID=UPI00016AE442|nr:hypothetical protein [Burkholderia humptydooensis]AJY38756.1 hypothetical protein BW21_4870 [Burkholderia sp. 2002721687]ALX46357.1 hypothetical protein AQ610_28790 [Burkholderia humptydooensis]